MTDCAIVVQISKEIEPLQKKLQSSVLRGGADPRAAAQLQAEDYDSIGAKIRELSREMSASELRDLTLTLSGRYTDIGQSIERDLAATTHDYRAQCPVN